MNRWRHCTEQQRGGKPVGEITHHHLCLLVRAFLGFVLMERTFFAYAYFPLVYIFPWLYFSDAELFLFPPLLYTLYFIAKKKVEGLDSVTFLDSRRMIQNTLLIPGESWFSVLCSKINKSIKNHLNVNKNNWTCDNWNDFFCTYLEMAPTELNIKIYCFKSRILKTTEKFSIWILKKHVVAMSSADFSKLTS